MGCIGRDEFGKIMEEKMKEIGVNVVYKYVDTEPTGTCAVCVTGTGTNRYDDGQTDISGLYIAPFKKT